MGNGNPLLFIFLPIFLSNRPRPSRPSLPTRPLVDIFFASREEERGAKNLTSCGERQSRRAYPTQFAPGRGPVRGLCSQIVEMDQHGQHRSRSSSRSELPNHLLAGDPHKAHSTRLPPSPCASTPSTPSHRHTRRAITTTLTPGTTEGFQIAGRWRPIALSPPAARA